MRAVIHTRYGNPDVLQLTDVERPRPEDNEVLVRVHATTVNRGDCGFRAASPIISRGFSGLRRPKRQILGSELAGEVVEIGSGVSQFSVGDRVFGSSAIRLGAHAEYVCIEDGGALATMPDGITFETAACACDGAILALTFLRRLGTEPGQRILIYGASGAIGTAAVQLAKHLGAEVTAVCSTKDLDTVKALGADVVIDYTSDDFTRSGEVYDVVFDAVGKHSFRRCRRSLTRTGLYAGTDLGFLWHTPLFGWITAVTARVGGRRVVFPLPRYTKQDVELLKGLMRDGTYRPVIDRCYPLEDVVEATRYVETQQKTGNVVLRVYSDDAA